MPMGPSLPSPVTVALRKEGVDRNMMVLGIARSALVALRKEGVDRNKRTVAHIPHALVALRKEGVDRNQDGMNKKQTLAVSPSARRAWIEIAWPFLPGRWISVALRKEGVDRNCRCTGSWQRAVGRPPQGGRG